MPPKVAPKTASKTPGKKPGVVSGGARATKSSPNRRTAPAPRATTPAKPTAKPASRAVAKPTSTKPAPKAIAKPAPKAAAPVAKSPAVAPKAAAPVAMTPAVAPKAATPVAMTPAVAPKAATPALRSPAPAAAAAPIPQPLTAIATSISADQEPAADAAASIPGVEPKLLSGSGAVAAGIVTDAQTADIAALGAQLVDDRVATATQAARVLEEVLALKPEMLVTLIDRFVTGVLGDNPRVVQTCAAALPHMARLAPARVARHLQLLTDSFSAASAPGKDGLVRTFAALCSASVAYQKRLEPVLDLALGQADAKTLVRWTEIVLPALKGEPHARARAVVEGRVTELPRPIAQKLADFLGIKLRRLGA